MGVNGASYQFSGRYSGGINNSASKVEKQQVSTGVMFFPPGQVRSNSLLVYKKNYGRNLKSCDHCVNPVCNIKFKIGGKVMIASCGSDSLFSETPCK